MTIKHCFYILLLLLLALLYGCDDMSDFAEDADNEEIVQEVGTAEFYVLCEGLFNLNNSSLTRYSYRDNENVNNYFRRINRRGLGDTANDLAIYGSKMYVVVNASNQVEVIDLHSGKSLKRIPVLGENGSSRQPRRIAFNKGKAYVCSFDGTVARIDTASLSIEAYAQAGRNPEDICVQNGKLYVSNSGGLDKPNYGNTVSVIDIVSFKEIAKITVGSNPGRIGADSYGNVFVATRGNLTDNEYRFFRIDSQTDAVAEEINEPVLNFAIHNELIYLYNYDYSRKTSWFKVYDIAKKRIVQENFITDGTMIQTPYSINVNPYSGNIYITDAYNYQVKGDVLCFNMQGQLQFRLKDVGINPNAIVFSDHHSQSNIDEPEDPGRASAFANRVVEYLPAPGQFINTSASAYKEGYTAEEVLGYATEQIQKRSLLSLGGFGGYITLGFDHTVPNVVGSYDLKIYGNSYTNQSGKGGSAEPGIVLVSKDTNGNGLPDDEWYELAGSEFFSDQVIRNYEITYFRPSPLLADVEWRDNLGKSGVVPRVSFHADNSYYPTWVEEEELTFSGTRLPDNAINEGTAETPDWVQYPFGWGYADNRPNSSELSCFKIDWAVDKEGNPVPLDGIDFVRIYCAVNQVCGWLGETSTEVSAVEDLHFE